MNSGAIGASKSRRSVPERQRRGSLPCVPGRRVEDAHIHRLGCTISEHGTGAICARGCSDRRGLAGCGVAGLWGRGARCPEAAPPRDRHPGASGRMVEGRADSLAVVGSAARPDAATLWRLYVDEGLAIAAMAKQWGWRPRRCITGWSPPVGSTAEPGHCPRRCPRCADRRCTRGVTRRRRLPIGWAVAPTWCISVSSVGALPGAPGLPATVSARRPRSSLTSTGTAA
jgi:hypothetical protein